MKSFVQDRPFLENKYHKVGEPFNPYNRMAYHGYEFDESTGKSDEEIRAGLLELKLDGLPHPVAKATAVKYVLDNTRIDVGERDYFVGFWSVNRLASEVTLKKWWQELTQDALRATSEKMADMNEAWAVNIWADFDHVVPDWDALLTLGFSGLRERARAYRRRREEQGALTAEEAAHFEGIDIEYGGILALIDRLYRLAKTRTHAKAERVATCLAHIRDGAPTDLFEAMQTMYIYFMVSECFDNYQVRSLGNGLDGTLYPFYQAELAKGRSREEIKELFAYFLFQWSAIGNYWGQPFYMGGTNLDGSTKYNELSALILEVYLELEIYNPKIQIKVNRNTPDEILYRVFDGIRKGKSSFVFCCEPGYIRAVMGYGASYEEALNMDLRGCYETGVRANEVSSATGYVNALKPVEYVFSNGYDKKLGKQFGLRTGELTDLKTFEDFYSATLAQWAYLIETTIEVANDYERYLSFVNPSTLYSATIEGSLAKGRDAYQDGVKFNNSAILNCGMASLVDSVMAVKELVYDEKILSLSELKTALDNDWVGYEAFRARARKSKRKYGNGDEETDRYAAAMAGFFASRVNNRPNARGGVYKAEMHSAMEFVWQGQNTGATPDGRRAGEENSKNGSPSVGMDRNGVTALIRSALKLRPSTYHESFCLDVTLHPSAVEGEEGLRIMKALLTTYLEGGGMALQMNVFNADTLRDAQKNPERYKNLQVRVCGWNVLWNNLSKAEQDAYILRAENVR